MSKRFLRIEIEAGDSTCRASADAAWCVWVHQTRRGTRWECALWNRALADSDGWLQRTPWCLAAEEGSTDAP